MDSDGGLITIKFICRTNKLTLKNPQLYNLIETALKKAQKDLEKFQTNDTTLN